MKHRNRILAVIVIMATIICATGLTAHAATGTKVFDGYTVTVLDKATPAVDMRGRPNDRTVICFVSADDKEVGVMAYNDYLAVMEKNKFVIQYADGSKQNAPPDGNSKWNEWFADKYNEFRGLVAGSREEAVATHTAETIEKYRKEVVRLVNLEREKSGLPELDIDDDAMKFAQVRAEELAVSFSHTRPNNETNLSEEIGAFNENIARGQPSPERAMSAWMDSPGHRANILNDDAFAIGVGCYWNGAEYRWCQIFLW